MQAGTCERELTFDGPTQQLHANATTARSLGGWRTEFEAPMEPPMNAKTHTKQHHGDDLHARSKLLNFPTLSLPISLLISVFQSGVTPPPISLRLF